MRDDAKGVRVEGPSIYGSSATFAARCVTAQTQHYVAVMHRDQLIKTWRRAAEAWGTVIDSHLPQECRQHSIATAASLRNYFGGPEQRELEPDCELARPNQAHPGGRVSLQNNNGRRGTLRRYAPGARRTERSLGPAATLSKARFARVDMPCVMANRPSWAAVISASHLGRERHRLRIGQSPANC